MKKLCLALLLAALLLSMLTAAFAENASGVIGKTMQTAKQANLRKLPSTKRQQIRV